MNFRPLHDLILLEVDKPPSKSSSGIIFVDDHRKIYTGTVKAVGPGKKVQGKRVPVGVEAGDKVAFFRWNLEHKTGKKVTSFLEMFGEDFGLIRAADVLFAFSASDNVKVE